MLWRRKDCNDVCFKSSMFVLPFYNKRMCMCMCMCYEDEAVRQCVPDLDGGNRKSSAAVRRKSEGWYNETVGARGAERASTRYIGNAVEWSLIPGATPQRTLWVSTAILNSNNRASNSPRVARCLKSTVASSGEQLSVWLAVVRAHCSLYYVPCRGRRVGYTWLLGTTGWHRDDPRHGWQPPVSPPSSSPDSAVDIANDTSDTQFITLCCI